MSTLFNFSIIDSENETCKCIVYIVIENLDYKNSNTFYSISYTYDYSTEDSHYLNPFYKCDDGMTGVVVKKNKLTDTLVEFLTMSDEKLKPLIGNIGICDYKAATMRSLALLWD